MRAARRGWLAFAALAALAATSRAETYTNLEYGFSVDLPPGAPTCTDAGQWDNHGVIVYLDSGPNSSPGGCDGLDERPYIGVSAGYNAAGHESLEDLLSDVCAVRAIEPVDPPAGLAFAGRRTAACRHDSSDRQRVEIFAESLAGGPGVATLEYGANLHTSPARLDKDVATFRGFLAKRIHLKQPEFFYGDSAEYCATAEAGNGRERCLSEQLAKAEAELALRRRELEARMSRQENARFKEAQEAWSRYRDSSCAVLPEKRASCRASLTEDRVREIERMGEPDP